MKKAPMKMLNLPFEATFRLQVGAIKKQELLCRSSPYLVIDCFFICIYFWSKHSGLENSKKSPGPPKKTREIEYINELISQLFFVQHFLHENWNVLPSEDRNFNRKYFHEIDSRFLVWTVFLIFSGPLWKYLLGPFERILKMEGPNAFFENLLHQPF